MSSCKRSDALAAFALGALGITAQSASAYVACNAAGECRPTEHRYRAPDMWLQWRTDDCYFHRSWDHDH